jgi:hypothetical protein
MGRGRDWPETFLRGFAGKLQCDGNVSDMLPKLGDWPSKRVAELPPPPREKPRRKTPDILASLAAPARAA